MFFVDELHSILAHLFLECQFILIIHCVGNLGATYMCLYITECVVGI